MEQAIEISGDMIQHGQLLKLAGTATGGADAKALIANGHVTVNGEPELRRGRELHQGERAGAGHTGCASALKCGQIWAPRDAMSRQTRREHRVGRTRRSAASWARLLTAK